MIGTENLKLAVLAAMIVLGFLAGNPDLDRVSKLKPLLSPPTEMQAHVLKG